MAIKNIYWDANVFNAIFGSEKGRTEICERIEADAVNGSIMIYTSAVTFVECLKIRGKQIKNLTPEDEAQIEKYFKNEFIKVINCDRKIGEAARALIWKFPHLQPYDSVHIASALSQPIDVFHTYDDHDLVKLSGKIGTPPMRICHPEYNEPPPPPPPSPELPLATPPVPAQPSRKIRLQE